MLWVLEFFLLRFLFFNHVSYFFHRRFLFCWSVLVYLLRFVFYTLLLNYIFY